MKVAIQFAMVRVARMIVVGIAFWGCAAEPPGGPGLNGKGDDPAAPPKDPGKAPNLTVERPTGASGCQTITIRGETTTATTVTVIGGARGASTQSDGNGKFYATVDLSVGPNTLRLQAFNAYGVSQVEEVIVQYNPGQAQAPTPAAPGQPLAINILKGPNRVYALDGMTLISPAGDAANALLTDGMSNPQAVSARWDLWASASARIALAFPVPVVVNKIRVVGGPECFPYSYQVYVASQPNAPFPFFEPYTESPWIRMPAPGGTGNDDIVPQAEVRGYAVGLSVDWSNCYWAGDLELKEIEVYTTLKPEDVPTFPTSGCR